MTANQLGELDKALVRPGRVDMQFRFQLPRRPELEVCFLAMYPPSECDDNTAVRKACGNAELAQTFAGGLPEGHFSYVELQEFIL